MIVHHRLATGSDTEERGEGEGGEGETGTGGTGAGGTGTEGKGPGETAAGETEIGETGRAETEGGGGTGGLRSLQPMRRGRALEEVWQCSRCPFSRNSTLWVIISGSAIKDRCIRYCNVTWQGFGEVPEAGTSGGDFWHCCSKLVKILCDIVELSVRYGQFCDMCPRVFQL